MLKIKTVLQLCYVLLIFLHLAAPLAMAQRDNEVLVIDVDGPVTPVMLSFIERSIEEADVRNNEALIIRLNTPGGSVDLTREIIQTIIASDVPVVVYVWPRGGFAASAGTFITLAGHVAAMSPNTSIGAASPVDGSGAEIDETMRAKIENILTADMRSLAERRGEDAVKWAEEAITEAKAANAEEALELGIIDVVAEDIDDLLTQIDGMTVEVNGDEVTLDTANAGVSYMESTFLENLLSVISNPTISLLLVSLGGLAIAYEIINPGGYIGGIVGVIMLLVGMYGIGQLPVNYAGLALIILAIVLFIAEVFTPTFGALTAAGIGAFILGGLILFNTSEFAYDIPIGAIIGIPVGMALVVAFGLAKIAESVRTKTVTGQEALVGSVGTAKSPLEPDGSVLVWGQRWSATSEDGETIPTGSRVEVTSLDGFHLKVKQVK